MQVQFPFPGQGLDLVASNSSHQSEIANLDKSILILKSDDRGIGTQFALVVHGC